MHTFSDNCRHLVVLVGCNGSNNYRTNTESAMLSLQNTESYMVFSYALISDVAIFSSG
jgi:hypothetical protein